MSTGVGVRCHGHIPNYNGMLLWTRRFKHLILLHNYAFIPHNCLRVKTKVSSLSLIHTLAVKDGWILITGYLRPPFLFYPHLALAGSPQGRQMELMRKRWTQGWWPCSPFKKSVPFLQGFLSLDFLTQSFYILNELAVSEISFKTITARSFCWQK